MQLLLYHPHIHVSSSHHLSSARRPPLRTAPLHLNHPSPRCALSPPSPLHHRHCHPLSTRAGPPGLLHILPPDSSIYSSMSAPQPSSTPPAGDPARDQSITQYRKKFLEHRELEAKVKKTRFELRALVKEFDKTEDDLKAVQNVGQIIGEVLKQLDSDRFIVKASSGPRYVVGVRSKVNKASMTAGTRVALDMTTLTIMRTLPREVDPVVFNMLNESPGSISYADIGGLNEQIRELREVIELPLTNPDLFKRVGIKPPKGVLLYGPPGTGKTLLARALANNIKASYLKVVASAIVDKYIGECLSPGTRVMLWDGRSKVVEEIVEGDELMGDDGQPRVVQKGTLVHGRGEMYEVTSANEGRMTWSCTLNHVLVLTINARPIATHSRDEFVILYWALEQARTGPTPTSRPVRRTMTTGSRTENGGEEALEFASREEAEEWIELHADQWQPLVFECTVGEYLKFSPLAKSVSAMFSPAGGVDFKPPHTPLRTRLEAAFGHAVSDAQLLDSAWAIGVWLADGHSTDACVLQIGTNTSEPQHSHVPVIQGLVRWRLSMDDEVCDLAPTTVDEAVLKGLTPRERGIAEAVVRSDHYTSAGNRPCTVQLGAHMLAVLRSYGIVDAKHFPHELLAESKAVRRALLEGVIDGDGQLHHTADGLCEYELPARERFLLDGTVHLARGLGLSTGKVTRREKPRQNEDTGEVYTGWRVRIGGLHSVTQPLQPRLLYQRVDTKAVKDDRSPLCDAVTIRPAGEGEWFGFQVDGNRRFLLDDFVVTHNSARIIREMFGYAKEHQPCVIFMDEVDAIGGRRFSQGTSADREIQRTLMELLNQLDGFDDLGRVKMVMATNRPDTLDPALLRPGRLDRKIEIPIPSESNRLDILKIHAASVSKHGDIDYEGVVKLCEGFNGADLRNVCLTGDHRVLTSAGWKSIAAVRVGDLVLSLNINKDKKGKYTWAQEWKPVRRTQCYDSKAYTLHRMQGIGMDVVATHDHSMLLARLGQGGRLQEGKPIGYETVGELLGLTYRPKDTSKHTLFHHNQNRAVVCAGHNLQADVKIIIPGMERVCEWWWAKDRQLAFLQFIGFWLGDGWLHPTMGKVCITQQTMASTAWLEELFPAVFPRWYYRSTNTKSGAFIYNVRCPPLYNYLRKKAVGPLGYNPRDPQALRSYPHFTYDPALAAEELTSDYYIPDNSSGYVSTWTEDAMLAAMTGIDAPSSVTRSPPSATRSRSSAGSVSSSCGLDSCVGQDEDQPMEVADDELKVDEETDGRVEQQLADTDIITDEAPQQTRVAGAALIPWNDARWLVTNGRWFYLKRWMGDAQEISNVYSRLSKAQAVALLDGFCRADGRWKEIRYLDDNDEKAPHEPTGQWSCCNSSFPLLDHLMLIGQLAGAAVDLALDRTAGTETVINGVKTRYSVNRWVLCFSFTKSNKPFQTAPFAEPLGASAISARGYYNYEDDGKVYDITVTDNSNFLTQRLSVKRIRSGADSTGVRAHSVFVGNCTEAGMFAIRVERGYVIEEDFMKAARKIMETKKLEGKLEYEKV